MFKKSFRDSDSMKEAARTAFTRERIICRLIASWTLFAALKVLGGGKYCDLSFAQNTSLATVALYVILFFGLLSVVHMLVPDRKSVV